MGLHETHVLGALGVAHAGQEAPDTACTEVSSPKNRWIYDQKNLDFAKPVVLKAIKSWI